jgi:hypothetical protein
LGTSFARCLDTTTEQFELEGAALRILVCSRYLQLQGIPISSNERTGSRLPGRSDLINWQISRGLETCRRPISGGAYKVDLKRKLLAASVFLLLLPWLNVRAEDEGDDLGNASSAAILNKYLQATQNHEDALRGASMEVDINATVFKLKEHGTLRALRKISKVGQITYRVLGFQGDNTVKNQVIARYLQAEQQGQGDQNLAITPANYKFKFKGQKQGNAGDNVYVFQLSPRKKKVGLFKGELWLDSNTCLPVLEKGRLVKNPSIFFKKVDFERAFSIKDGVAIPQHMNSTIETRLIGKVEINIDYTHFEANGESEEGDGPVSVALAGSGGK